MNTKLLFSIRRVRSLIALAVLLYLFFTASAWAEDIYISQTAQGANTGLNCANAYSASWFNASVNWGVGAGKIGAGDTVHLCGTITTSLVAQGSGSTGSPITILFEAGAKISKTSCGTYCLSTNRNTYLTIDGGTDGIIEATAMGTGRGQGQSTAIEAGSCSNCEIKNLHIRDMYVRTNTADNLGGNDASTYNAIAFSGSNFLFHNNTIHDVGWAIRDLYGSGDNNVKIYNNDISNCGHALALAAVQNTTAGSFYYYNNYVHDFANWDSSGCTVAHTSAIHAYGIGGAKITGTLWIYNNRFIGTGSCMTANIFLEGGSDAWTDATGTAKIFNNLITASGYVTGLVQPYKGTNHEIYNNTIIGDGNSSTVCLAFGGTSTNVKVKNNYMGGCGFLIKAYANETIQAGFELDYNVYANCSGYNCFWVGNTDTGSFTSYRTAKPSFDIHSIGETSSTGGLNLYGVPQAGSPVIGGGANLSSLGISALNWDILGAARPQSSPWDIGAYNFFNAMQPPVSPPVNLRISP